ncbi:hypothetical protein EB796_003148 [Bugula neritina]|uniref:Uncharacterized protein n=1 Tax=Bugula neritina TaxID=10212 RepID=A0A7J7KKK8_BUGNE|nr:hypothetical protein EB796_003148 [Bugula neritina]
MYLLNLYSENNSKLVVEYTGTSITKHGYKWFITPLPSSKRWTLKCLLDSTSLLRVGQWLIGASDTTRTCGKRLSLG